MVHAVSLPSSPLSSLSTTPLRTTLLSPSWIFEIRAGLQILYRISNSDYPHGRPSGPPVRFYAILHSQNRTLRKAGLRGLQSRPECPDESPPPHAILHSQNRTLCKGGLRGRVVSATEQVGMPGRVPSSSCDIASPKPDALYGRAARTRCEGGGGLVGENFSKDSFFRRRRRKSSMWQVETTSGGLCGALCRQRGATTWILRESSYALHQGRFLSDVYHRGRFLSDVHQECTCTIESVFRRTFAGRLV